MGWIGLKYVCGDESGRERGVGGMEGIVNVALIHLGVRYEYERTICICICRGVRREEVSKGRWVGDHG